MEIKSCLKNIFVGMVKNGFDHCSQDSKIDSISRSNQLNKLIVGISDSNGIRTHNHLVGMLIRI